MKTKEQIEQLANDYWEGCDGCDANDKYFFIKGFSSAYRQLKEDMADKKYTEDDIREAIDMARMLSHVSCLEDGEHRLKYSNTEEDIIKSLNKQD